MKILLVGSINKTIDMLSKKLTLSGHVVSVSACKAALQQYKAIQPDLFIIDGSHLEQETITFIEQVKWYRFDIFDWKPILYLCEDNEAFITKAIDAGADGVLKHPISVNQLTAHIKAMQRLSMMQRDLVEYSQQMRILNDKLIVATQQLTELSYKDSLTRLFNRRAFHETFDKMIKHAKRQKHPLSMIMIDIDYFKQYNDSYGHQMGDKCLKQLADFFVKALHRPEDFIARFGGEEFVILLPNTELTGAMSVAERLREALIALKIPHETSPHAFVTASLGVTCIDEASHVSPEYLIQFSDLALYRAKKEGRNCVREFKK